MKLFFWHFTVVPKTSLGDIIFTWPHFLQSTCKFTETSDQNSCSLFWKRIAPPTANYLQIVHVSQVVVSSLHTVILCSIKFFLSKWPLMILQNHKYSHFKSPRIIHQDNSCKLYCTVRVGYDVNKRISLDSNMIFMTVIFPTGVRGLLCRLLILTWIFCIALG